jgi:hypothetical protein
MFLGAFMALLVLGQAIKLDVLRFSDLARSVARPLLACTVMAAALYQLQGMVDLSPTLSLAVQIPLGAAIYSTILLGAWWLSGRPASGETFILGLVGTKLRRSSV